MKYQTTKAHRATVSMIALGLAACGGGGGDDTAPATPTVTTTTFSGTAATGAAMANATVSISCVSGAGSTTTSATGTYSKDIDSVTLPCALRAASADGTTVLYSVSTATATGANKQVANITPLTQLVVASLTGAAPATFFDNFNATTATVATPASVGAAQTAVLDLVTSAGIDTAGVTDLIGGTLAAGSHAGYDSVLDALKTQLDRTGTAPEALTAAVAATSPAATAPGTTVVDHTARLPAGLLLKTATSNCTALRSGDYVGISPRKGSTLDAQVAFLSFDASTLTLTDNTHPGAGGTLSPGSIACSYTMGGNSYVVSQAGILMGAEVKAGVPGLSLLIPKQTIAVAELAGSWNALDFEKNNAGTYSPHALTAEVSSGGAFTNVNDCVGGTTTDTCSVSTTTISLTSNSAGGFDLVGSGSNTWTQRAFAYRSGSGDVMLLSLGGGGSLTVWAKKRTLVLPAVGTAYPASWSLRVNNQLVSAPLDFSYAGSVTAVDAATGMISRTWNRDAVGTPDYTDTVTINSPRDGYNLRRAQNVTATDGRTVGLRERTSMGLPGMGVSFQTLPAINSFQMGLDQ